MAKISVLATFFVVSVCFARTVIDGEVITTNTWWRAENSPYILTNDVVVAPQARLVIEAGVEVLIERPIRIPEGIEQLDNLDSQTVSIKVFGALHALGTPTRPIVFRGLNVEEGNQFTHWYGIVIRSARTQDMVIGYATISSAAHGIRVIGGQPLIRNVLFTFNNIGVRVEDRSTARIAHSVFSQNFLTGIRVYNSNPLIYNSILVNNNMTGLWGDSHARIDFRHNLLFDNGRDFSLTDPLFGRNDRVNSNGDSTDFKGNMVMEPIFLGSFAEAAVRKEGRRAERRAASYNIMESISADDVRRRFFLSPFSPAIDAGVSDRVFREIDGSLPDLGIWGGPETLRF
ncbi:MAG: right-handed parallel beta-helix repeat-containing protein [Chitinivibrionia bacterium]|nr:right-handed parallel beta-helix repeat-containing protein [Chitinivibrionia bacterium]